MPWGGRVVTFASNYSAIDVANNGYFKDKWCYFESSKQNMPKKKDSKLICFCLYCACS